MLSVEHVSKRFGTFTALEDVSLTFEPGVYGLVAPNGAGKTTLIKMLATLLFPTEGQILWDGEDIVSLGESYRARLGYLPQEFGYYPAYTPRQFLRYVAALQRIPRTVADPRIDELLETVGIAEVADKKMRQFSGGMLQRVGIAQAMVNDPELLILDEPTSGLDPRERVRFRNLVHALAADRIAGQIVMFRDHRLHCCDSASNICAQLQDRVFEVPANMALAPGQLLLSEREGAQGPVLRIASDEPPAQGTPVAACLEDAFLYIYRDVEEGERP